MTLEFRFPINCEKNYCIQGDKSYKLFLFYYFISRIIIINHYKNYDTVKLEGGLTAKCKLDSLGSLKENAYIQKGHFSFQFEF